MTAKMTGWTYGAEHEWGDWHYNGPLPDGYGRDVKDFTCMSSNGIANDPRGISYAYGGEINTPPYISSTSLAQGAFELRSFLGQHGPFPTINHRSNLHIHIRVPGLKDDLPTLKRVQEFIHEHMPEALAVIQPLPRPVVRTGQLTEEEHGALRRWRRRRVSHQTLLTSNRLAHQLDADTLEDFFRREVPQSKGKPQWHLQPRLCVNLRQLLETDTVEFRHFAGTLNQHELGSAADWCTRFMECAMFNDGAEFQSLLGDVRSGQMGWAFPKFPDYVHHLENRYRATCHDGTLKRPEIEANIQRILAGEFDDFPV